MNGQLQVHTSFFFFMWILFFCTPKIVINGQVQRRGWGVTRFDLPAGQYRITVSVPYFFFDVGTSTINVQIHPGQCTMIRWSCPLIIFLSGDISLVGVRPAGPLQLTG
jgi:hypothetical protein